jgi:hypothetical protein
MPDSHRISAHKAILEINFRKESFPLGAHASGAIRRIFAVATYRKKHCSGPTPNHQMSSIVKSLARGSSKRRIQSMFHTYVLPLATIAVLAVTNSAVSHSAEPRPLRAGMIGLDTSHVPAFAKLFNNPKVADDLAGMRIVAGYPGGTDLPASRDRVANFTRQLREMGIEIVDTIPKLLEKVDVVLLESVDGRIHLQEAIPAIEARKPLFIDKPAAGSLADAIAIYEFAKKHNVPCFSSSSLRYHAGIQELLKDQKIGAIVGAATWGPCSYQEGTPDMFFYGIHGIEPLYALMGTGCEKVSRVQTADTDLVSGLWRDGRVGTYRGIRRHKAEFGATVFGSKGIVQAGPGGGYEGLCREILRFFKEGKSPVSADETIEIFAFMEAADESKRQGGAPVSIADVLAKGRIDAAAKIPK